MKTSELIAEARWRLIVGTIVLLAVLGSTVWSTIHANNLIACQRQSIELVNEDGENLKQLFRDVTKPGITQQEATAAFANYQHRADDISKKREKIDCD